MDYKDLANAIYPDAKPIEYYEEKYGPRDLPQGAEVTRFAPSPTGFVHIGGLYQCIINRALAKQSNGVFMLRIEDTDQVRKIENGVNQIVEALAKFDFVPDEGMISETEEKGSYGPYKQSMRREIYHSYAKYLIEQGRAYPCFATPEEIDEIRKKQEAAGLRTGFYGVWAKYRDLPVDEAIARIKNGDKFVIRLRSQGREDRKIKVKDAVRGFIEFPENDQDAVLIKADGLPVYHFAHVVDDHLMRTTIVVRGEEWISSTPLHIEIFQAFGFKPPKYAQVPSILKEDDGKKRKISKRKDPEAAVDYYHKEGIPSDAVNEYLMNIINSSFEGWRRANPTKPMNEFKLELSKMGVSGAVFDMVKLLDVSKNVIARYSAEQVYSFANEWAKQYDEELAQMLSDKEYGLKVFGIERENSKKPRKDLSKWSDVKENIIYMYNKPESYDFDKINGEEVIKVIKEYINVYNSNDDKETWFSKMKDVAEKCGYAREVKEYKADPEKWPGHVGDISSVIRVAITGRRNTPDLYEIMNVLGNDEVIARLNKAIQ
jgi:glutamyl-tRNA synthetase